jgi:hypothetical protein
MSPNIETFLDLSAALTRGQRRALILAAAKAAIIAALVAVIA